MEKRYAYEGKTLGDRAPSERGIRMGAAMKRERYMNELDKVTAQAVTLGDVERMRDAMIESRAKLERKHIELKRAEFAKRSNGA